MDEMHKQANAILWLHDMLMTYYHALMFSEPSEEDKNTLAYKDISVYINQYLADNVKRHKIMLDDLFSCKIVSELDHILQSPIVYLDNVSSYTYACEKNSFGCFYDDPVANEWSNNMIHIDYGPRRSDIVLGLVFSLRLTQKLIYLNQDFVVMMQYNSERIDSVKVSFYLPRRNYPDLYDIHAINDAGYGRLLLITNTNATSL